MRVKVSLLYIDDCPNWRLAKERLVEALRLSGRSDAEVELRVVASDADAHALRFRGSPTIQIDGNDALAGDEDGTFGLTCRVYRTEAGLDGAPTVDQLVAALVGP